MINIDRIEYDEYQYIDKKPSRAYPRYGMEIELRPYKKFTDDDYWGSTSRYLSKDKKFVSRYFKQEILDEISLKIGKGLNWGPDGQNVEFRTEPGTKTNVLKQIVPLYKGKFKCFPENQPRLTGIHIHSDVRNYSPKEIYRKVKFLTSRKKGIYDLLKIVCRRGIRTEGSYGYIPPFNYYREYINEDYPSEREGIYLNSDHNTHEFRMFKTSTSIKEAAGCLDFIDAMTFYSRNKDFEISSSAFVNFTLENNKKFPFIAKILKENNHLLNY